MLILFQFLFAATCDKVEIFQVEMDNSTKTDHQSDSDEFDHFYD